MQKFSDTLTKFISYFIFTIAGILIFYLSVLSIFSTSHVSPNSHGSMEYTYFTSDNVFLHICVIMLFVIFCIVCTRISRSHPGKLCRILSIIAGITPFITAGYGIAWILYTRNVPFPVADQGTVMFIPMQMKNGDFSSFKPGEYMDMCHNQYGIVMFIYLISYIVGDYNYIAFQILNAISLGVIVFFMHQTSFVLTGSDTAADISCICCAAFTPLFLYTTFVYGTLLGLAMTAAAFFLLLNYIKNNKTSSLVISVILIIMSVFMKSNYLIAMIAYLIILMLNVIKEHKRSAIVCLLTTMPMYLLCSFILTTAYKNLTGITPSKGMPASVHIAMGLSENDSLAPGWYNDSFVSEYRNSDGDYEYTNALATGFIKNRLKEFIKNPAYAINFFSCKTASGWNEPTFQSFWLYQRNSVVSDEFIHHSAISDTLLGLSENTAAYRFIMNVLNQVHTLILLGAMLYILFSFKQAGTAFGYTCAFMPLFFVGGFLFHSFWEMKAQYTLPYFVMLIPMAVIGFKSFVNLIDTSLCSRKV